MIYTNCDRKIKYNQDTYSGIQGFYVETTSTDIGIPILCKGISQGDILKKGSHTSLSMNSKGEIIDRVDDKLYLLISTKNTNEKLNFSSFIKFPTHGWNDMDVLGINEVVDYKYFTQDVVIRVNSFPALLMIKGKTEDKLETLEFIFTHGNGIIYSNCYDDVVGYILKTTTIPFSINNSYVDWKTI